MARGRMLSKSLSTSEKRAALHEAAGHLAEFCQAVYPLLVAHADDWGCLQGDPFTVKHLVDPSSPRKVPEFGEALRAMHNVGLITWYAADGKQFIFIRDWFNHQQLKGHDKDGRNRTFPAPPETSSKIETSAQVRPESPKPTLKEENLREEKGREEKTVLTYLPTKPPARAPIPSDSLAMFERVYAAYPNKDRKQLANDEWIRLNPSQALAEQILANVQSRVKAGWVKFERRFIPQLRNYLLERQWEDTPESLAPFEDDPFAHLPHAWQCKTCGEVHEGTQEQGRLRVCQKRQVRQA